MLEALEKELYLDIHQKSRRKIIEIFRLAKAIQLPVVDDHKVVGILDLFVFLDNMNKNINLIDLIEKDIIVAGEYRNVFTFKNSKQQILPFVDEEGNFSGFVNKLFQKCYLPSEEYMQVVEKNLDGMIDNDSEVDYDKLKNSFSAIFESNYDGIYITVDKGTTLSINKHCKYADGITSDDISIDESKINVSFDENTVNNETVNVIQNIQKRKEVSVSDDVISDGGIIRVINNIKDFDKIKNELRETQKLAEKYQNELEFLRWEQTETDDIIAKSPEMKKVINLAVRISKVDSTVLIQGQSGVGKGVLSKLIHNSSDRKNGPFIKIDCGSIPENLLESELFGYEQGSFTGAEKGGKIGLIELANGGTLFLDEIGELPLNLQMKLLRVLQDKEIFRVGGKEPIPVDFRTIAATNRDLEEMVEQKKFRKDLFYRLNVVPIKILPLLDRKEDIKPLIEDCLNRFNKKYNLEKYIEPVALRFLIDYNWPGNVRELENIIEYLIVTTNSDKITKDDLPETILDYNRNLPMLKIDSFSSMKEAMDVVEKNLLIESMKNSKSTEEMAKILKLDRSTVIRKLQKHKIKAHF
ncbi:sigma 54-interacting transcriptional regulator [Sinanaerobacter chloroacetimidivorans]|uniref:Sigma 54-interacting transcriptional regulator n=1 Tax=Sinanaerobacter chloroacetimidivorans TaxID=2818044 RepID=A0A8J8B479_9FIRM|nr:sigma 54-interacting transcriptional regulator [Sinanaerobacter chloroacetimidivorans]MBR0600491.1 sigma 54-interacting transcriptional regulator [Sinanaerobacter chloroacetimidivorans]